MPSMSAPAPVAPTTISDNVDSSGTHSMRHPEFWFSDGSIVLVAHDTAFRVHKTFLARKSEVFRDMFALAHPETPIMRDSPDVDGKPALVQGQQLDGCPVVCLHGDSPFDAENFLRAIYDGPKFGDNGKEDFRIVSGILRLATKYVVDSLRGEALAHLSKAWPMSLKGWDTREEVVSGLYGSIEEPRFYPNPVEVINLAREVNAPSLLLSAFYDLSRYALSDIFDHSLDTVSEISITPDSPTHPHELHTLSLADTQRLVLGRESARAAVSALIRSLAAEARSNPAHVYAHASPPPHQANSYAPTLFLARSVRNAHRRVDSGTSGQLRCSSPAACWRDVCELGELAAQHYVFDRERGSADPLYVAEELALLKGAGASNDNSAESGYGAGSNGYRSSDDDDEDGSCRACARAFELWARKERERIWRSIPGWFRLDS